MGKLLEQPLPRVRGRPPTSKVELLRVALTFDKAKELCGGSLGKLADAYSYERTPERADAGMRGDIKPFSQYIGAIRICSPNDPGSRLRWVMGRYPECRSVYYSPLFDLLERIDSPRSLVEFSHEIWTQHRIDPAVKRKAQRALPIALCFLQKLVLWSNTRDVKVLIDLQHLDVLCILLIAQRASTGSSEKFQLAKWCEEWVQRWSESHSEMRGANALLDELVRTHMGEKLQLPSQTHHVPQ